MQREAGRLRYRAFQVPCVQSSGRNALLRRVLRQRSQVRENPMPTNEPLAFACLAAAVAIYLAVQWRKRR